MVAVFIFSLHVLAALYAFFRYKRDGLSEGFLAVGFFAVIFSVGWTLTTMLTNLLFRFDLFTQWYDGETSSLVLQTLRREINRDTIALILLTLAEVGFYYLLLRREDTQHQNKVTSA
jgi:hypothetical protein